MTPYALVSLAVGLIMPILLSATAILAFLFFSGFALAEFWKNWDFLAKASIVCALFMPYILPLLFSLLTGWLLTSRRTLPATLADRYIPLLLLPLLISLVVLSFYPSLISQCLYPALLDPRRGPWLSDMLYAAAGWFMFALGAFWGARKSAPAQERVRGLARMPLRRNSGNFLWFFLLLAKERTTFREAAAPGLRQITQQPLHILA